jgi:hypothetical protein
MLKFQIFNFQNFKFKKSPNFKFKYLRISNFKNICLRQTVTVPTTIVRSGQSTLNRRLNGRRKQGYRFARHYSAGKREKVSLQSNHNGQQRRATGQTCQSFSTRQVQLDQQPNQRPQAIRPALPLCCPCHTYLVSTTSQSTQRRAAPVSSTHANKQKPTRPTSFPRPRPSSHFPLASPPLLRRHRQQAPCGRCPVPRRSDAARSTAQRCGGSAAVGSTGSPTWATETATIMDARGPRRFPTSTSPLPLHPSAACLLRRSRALLMSRRRLLPSVTPPGAGGTRDGYTRTAPHPASPPAGAGTITTAAWSRTLSSPSPRSSSSR